MPVMTNKELQNAIDSLLEWLNNETNLKSHLKEKVIEPTLRGLLDEQVKRAKNDFCTSIGCTKYEIKR